MSRYPLKGKGRGVEYEHRQIAERVLGRTLPKGAEVHHFDGDTRNNSSHNLVICPSRAYHLLLHARTRALAACGHADWMRCFFCGGWDAKENLRIYVPAGRHIGNAYHRECNNAYQAKRNKAKPNGKGNGTKK